MVLKPRFDYQELLKTVTSREVSNEEPVPLITLDESLNHPTIHATIRTLCRRRLACGSRDLWAQRRIRSDGSQLNVTGRLPKGIPFPGLDLGKPSKHASWDDQLVLYLLVGHFAICSKLVLLTENTRNDVLGLRRLLANYIKPYLSLNHRNTFSLTVLFKKGKSKYEDYCKHVVKFFEEDLFDYGFSQHWL